MSFSGSSAADPCALVTVFTDEPVKMVFDVPGGRPIVDPQLDPSERTAIIVTGGQSGAASNTNAHYAPVHTSKIDQVDIINGQVYRAVDPMLGDTSAYTLGPVLSQGSLFLRVADALITANLYDRVILAPMAVGSSQVAHWIPGGYLNHRILAMATRLRAHGYTPTFVLWVNGVADNLAATSQANYLARKKALVSHIRTVAGWTCPIFCSLETIISAHPPYAPVRAAVTELTNGLTGPGPIVLGPDCDTLDDVVPAGPGNTFPLFCALGQLALGQPARSYRYDGCHWNENGAVAATALWMAVLQAYIAAHP